MYVTEFTLLSKYIITNFVQYLVNNYSDFKHLTLHILYEDIHIKR